MNVREGRLEGVLIFEIDRFEDSRGYFMETYQERLYQDAGVPGHFVQDNVSFSERGVLRGLHYQFPSGQGKLVSALAGEIFDVVVDVRRGSPTFGHWFGMHLSGARNTQVWIPEGLAHGFCVTSDTALFAYKCTDYYNPGEERTILWDDPEIGIAWPISNPIVSPKDSEGTRLRGLPGSVLPQYPT